LEADSLSDQTPNFALDTLDVSPNAYNTQESLGFLFNVPSGTEIRVPRDKSDWPPTVPFEAVYASAVMEHFGVCSVGIDNALKKLDYLLCPTADDKPSRDEAAIRGMGVCRPGGPTFDAYDMLLIYPFIATTPEE